MTVAATLTAFIRKTLSTNNSGLSKRVSLNVYVAKHKYSTSMLTNVNKARDGHFLNGGS